MTRRKETIVMLNREPVMRHRATHGWMFIAVCTSLLLLLLTSSSSSSKTKSSAAVADDDTQTTTEAETSSQPLLPTCQPTDFHYALTDCDENGVRWRVQVPKPDTCTGGAPAPPTRAVDCGYSCEPGQYLDMDASKCRKCPPGKYSLGGGEKFTDWSELPPDFAVASSPYYFTDDGETCNETFWEPIGNFIRSPDNTCSSKLSYTANLAKEGSVNFTYSLANDMNYFTVAVHNELCQQSQQLGGLGKPVTSTGEGVWKSIQLELEAGLNVITWKSEGLFLGTSFKIPRVYIRSVEVMGLQYTSDCTKCPPGTFSAKRGSSRCDQCEANTFSHLGSTNCTACNAELEYSVPGSGNCTAKKPCQKPDYYKIHSPCNENNQTKVSYNWIEPRICNPNLDASVKLPKSGKFEACAPCNPGMSIVNRTICDFCPLNQFSDGAKPCQECPPNTTPEYGMTFSYWNTLPPNMEASCVSTTSDFGCATISGWVMADTYIHTGQGHADDAFLILDLHVDGFNRQQSYFNGAAEELGTVSFVFSSECESEDCTLFFLEEINDANIVEYWIGPTQRMEYRYAVTSAGSRTFTWAFQKTDVTNINGRDNYRYTNDVVKIYDITITNTLTGGASSCKDCPLGSDHTGCIPCKPGQYVDEKSKGCKYCPEDTYVRPSDPVGKSACLTCPSGLKSKNGQECYSNCHVALNGKQYDLSHLQGQHSVMSGASFLTEGSAFYYHFNLSLCGMMEKNLAMCVDNSSAIGQIGGDDLEILNSWVCRAIMMPGSDHPSHMTSIKPISLGDTLLGVNDGDKLGVVNDTIIPQPKEGLKDLRFYYHSPMTTKACPKGRSTIITLRCDPNEDRTDNIELPTTCPTGTCDGCTFHMLWTSQHACPLCRKEDIVSITQECKHGVQITSFMWNDSVQCVNGVPLPKETTSACEVPAWYSQVPLYAQIIITAFVVCAVLLCAMVVCIWKKNRKLEYKYEKLVSTASGELPAADSCAIEDGEEEDDVRFEDGGKKKSRSFLSKFKPRSSDKEYSHMEDSLLAMH